MSGTAVAVIEQKGNLALQDARALTITTQDVYVQACEFKKSLKAISKEIDDTFDPVISSAHAAHREALAAKAKHYGPVKAAMDILTTKTTAWDQEQERLRLIEETRIRELARAQEAERALLDAVQAEADGMLDEAESILQEAIAAPPPVVFVPKPPPVAGISYTEKWDFEVVNEALIPREFLVRDDMKIRRVVTAMKAQTSIPGIRAFAKKIQNTRL